MHSMSITAGPAAATAAPSAAAAGSEGLPAVATAGSAGRGWVAGIALMTASGTSASLGAAIAAQAFPVLGPVGVVAVRQWVASSIMLATIRPRAWRFTRRQWGLILPLALVYATMNVGLYVAISRIGLGLAVTLEFLGPLSVALLASRRAIDLGCAVVAGAAVVVLGRPQPSTDYVGMALALMAAAGWACYILLNRVNGRIFRGAEGSAVAISLSALLYIPAGIWMLGTHSVTGPAIVRAAVAGLMCTIVPMVFDVRALKKVPPRFYGVFMSINPVISALCGLAVLGQHLGVTEWAAIAAIVMANAVSIAARDGRGGDGRPSRPSERDGLGACGVSGQGQHARV
jgi:inner membrane transporter RhtA